MEHRIRLRYSTIMNYSAMIYRMLIAVGFAIIVARRLQVAEYGLWGIILSASLMLSTPITLWATWAPRFTARGWKEAGTTGLVLTMLYWIPGGLVYLLVSFFEEDILGWGLTYMLLGTMLMFLQTLDSFFGSMVIVLKPEIRAYRGFIYETLRIVFAYLFLVYAGLRLDGVVLSVSLALLAAVLYVGVELYGLGVFTKSFSPRLARDWLRAWYLPTTGLLQSFLRSGLRAAVSWVTGSEIPVAYLNVGFSAEAPLLQASGAGTSALYARSLRSRRGQDIEETFRLFLFFIGYMLPVFLILSKAIATLYNPVYIEAYIVISTVSIYAFINGFTMIYGAVLSGIETVDLNGIPDNRALISSYLFKLPVTRLVSTISAYMLFIPLLYYYRANPLLAAESVVVALLVTTLPLLIYYARKTSIEVSYKFPVKEAIAVSVSALAMSIYYMFVGAYKIIVTHFWAQFPILALHLAIGLVIYLIVLYITSPWTRKLFHDALVFAGLKNTMDNS
ncbi:MAG: hypothetical protein F7B59_02230 [Desulfurococcales archaeon]|nr:hypothetical protein [Desulfurococcales archaeon]